MDEKKYMTFYIKWGLKYEKKEKSKKDIRKKRKKHYIIYSYCFK